MGGPMGGLYHLVLRAGLEVELEPETPLVSSVTLRASLRLDVCQAAVRPSTLPMCSCRSCWELGHPPEVASTHSFGSSLHVTIGDYLGAAEPRSYPAVPRSFTPRGPATLDLSRRMLATMATLMMPAPAPTMPMNHSTLPLAPAKPEAAVKCANHNNNNGQKQGKVKRLISR